MTTETKSISFTVTNGPNFDRVIDALKYGYLERADLITLKFTIIRDDTGETEELETFRVNEVRTSTGPVGENWIRISFNAVIPKCIEREVDTSVVEAIWADLMYLPSNRTGSFVFKVF